MEKARLECPNCRLAQSIEIPEEKCLQLHICSACGYMISAKDCCVICEYTDKKCPKPED